MVQHTSAMRKDSNSNEQLRMHGALILANVFFGVGGVVGALGLKATHPLSFALLREFWAGLILLGISIYLQNVNDHEAETSKRLSPSSHHSSSWLYPLLAWRVHWKSFVLLGLAVFGNQAGFIVGIKMAGPVTAAVWQPSQPIFTAAISMALLLEPPQRKRILGITVAFIGCITMVLIKHNSNTKQDTSTEAVHQHNAARYLMGNAFFFANCLCTSLYVILSKRMLALYPALLVTAWSYNFASLCMLGATVTAAALPASQAFFCPECSRDDPFWYIAPSAQFALVYYIVFASVGSYGLLTWANQFATGTLVMSYTVLQPCTAALLTTALLVLGVVVNCQQQEQLFLTDEMQLEACLDYPTLGTFCGMLGVFGGLALIIATEPSSTHPTENDKHEDGADSDEDDGVETIPLTSSVEEDS
mmetsp:Transcript_13120/g.24858  ORF Transcript_13120/g.24858 Transcript_13120/m.24858 type:complete len:418 (+) Transcript_13120:125-1378(+)